ncbi:hypothetical protein M9H77_28653 [Catharanthus roseus]|uniref:Uncharacterized protein n=1 Tax=Catharanthus roseus TaxID=4058 RepID=A0ACC0AG77_CATRO|nr:hypothetical protein M9H77_28653 [Catharanthus roseus]
MVRPEARRGDDDLGAVTDRTGQDESRAMTASSRGVRGRHSTSDIPPTSAPIALGMNSSTFRSEEMSELVPSAFIAVKAEREDVGGHDDDDDDDGDNDGDDHESVPVVEASSSDHRPAPGKGKGLTGSFMSVMSKIAGSRQKRPEKLRPPTNPTQRKKSKNDGWEQTSTVDGDPQDLVIVPSYSGHVAGCIRRGQDRGILKSRSHYVSLTGWTLNDLAVVQLAGETGLSHLRSCMFQHPNSSLLSAFMERWQSDTNSFHMA